MSKLIILSAPIGAGKTALSNYIEYQRKLEGNYTFMSRCKDRLFTITAEVFGMNSFDFKYLYEVRSLKEVPNAAFTITPKAFIELCAVLKTDNVPYERDSFTGKIRISVRSAMIYVSECIAKPLFGLDYFGIERAKTLTGGEQTWFIDDSALGTMDEIIPAIDRLGDNNVVAVRIYGRGTYENDSRCYLPDGCMKNMIDVYNEGDLQEFLDSTYRKIKEVVGE